MKTKLLTAYPINMHIILMSFHPNLIKTREFFVMHPVIYEVMLHL